MLTSHLSIAALGNSDQPQDEGVWEQGTQSAGDTCRQGGGSVVKTFPLAHGWAFFDRVCDVVSRCHVHLVTSKSPILCSSSHSPARYPFTYSHFPPWEKSQAEFSLGAALWHSEGGFTLLKWNPFAYTMWCVQFELFCFVLFQWCAGTSPLDSWTSTKTTLSVHW